ncbi:MAG: hypothetical protein RR224_02250 [Clostridia bacterium]
MSSLCDCTAGHEPFKRSNQSLSAGSPLSPICWPAYPSIDYPRRKTSAALTDMYTIKYKLAKIYAMKESAHQIRFYTHRRQEYRKLKQFYRDVLDLEITVDFGANVIFADSIGLQPADT